MDIIGLIKQHELNDCYIKMLDYTMDLFESQGLGEDYYGYHNISHELEVTYVTLLAATQDMKKGGVSSEDLKYLFVAALFHDFDPQKSVDKPHEESVVRFIMLDKKLQEFLAEAKVDLEIVKALIYRTTFPWSGDIKKHTLKKINRCFMASELTRHDKTKWEHFMQLGWFLSIADRIAGYALGDFTKAMEISKMNAHALGWHPALIVRRAVAYFEHLINEESEMCQRVLQSLPKQMRKNLMDTMLSFLRLREHEIRVQADYVYENLKIVPIIEKAGMRQSSEFIDALFAIFEQLPRPLQFGKEKFAESIRDEDTILNTIRVGDAAGEIVGFAKGGPLERYDLRPEIKDENYGMNNTVFLEPLAIKTGYWGLRGGSEMRHLFVMQAHAKKFAYLTGFTRRDAIRDRVGSHENMEFVTFFDPERWDYYRVRL